ncbi:MAG: TetR/AcrR family transcriptional regulator C-terminal domain-containing protein [Lachnospiraceae bacterium]
MGNNTKRKIADGLQEMLRVKPLRKITVQDIMDCKNMKRQSFYYHFQDIYGVIEWVYDEDFVKQVAYDESEEFDTWICKVVKIIKENHAFYRKVLEHISRERVIKELYPVVDEQIRNRFWLGQNGNYLVESFIIKSVCHFILDCVAMKKGPEEDEVLAAVENIRAMLKLPSGNILVLPSTQSTMTA